MGKTLSNKKEFKKIIDAFNQYSSWAGEIINHVNYPLNDSHMGIDCRGLYYYVVLRKGIGLNKAQFTAEMEKVKNQYLNNDKKLVDEYLDFYDSVNYKNYDDSKDKNCLNMYLMSKWDQQMSTFREYNPKAVNNRYVTLEDKMQVDAKSAINSAYSQAFSAQLTYLLKDDELDKKSFNSAYSQSDLDVLNNTFSTTAYLDYVNHNANTYELELPDFVFSLNDIFNHNFAGKEDIKIDPKYKDTSLYDSYMDQICATVNNRMTFSGDISKKVKDFEAKSIYVDGVRLVDLAKKQVPEDASPRDFRNACAVLLSNYIKEGKAVDVAHPYADEKGNINTKVVPMSFKASKDMMKKLSDDYNREKHPIRFRFFNWGPFKLKDVDVMDMYKNKNMKSLGEREKKIVNDVNENFIKELNSKSDTQYNPGVLVDDEFLEKDKLIPRKVNFSLKDINPEEALIPFKKNEELDNSTMEIQQAKQEIQNKMMGIE